MAHRECPLEQGLSLTSGGARGIPRVRLREPARPSPYGLGRKRATGAFSPHGFESPEMATNMIKAPEQGLSLTSGGTRGIPRVRLREPARPSPYGLGRKRATGAFSPHGFESPEMATNMIKAPEQGLSLTSGGTRGIQRVRLREPARPSPYGLGRKRATGAFSPHGFESLEMATNMIKAPEQGLSLTSGGTRGIRTPNQRIMSPLLRH